jgi:hypothetical protein
LSKLLQLIVEEGLQLLGGIKEGVQDLETIKEVLV